MTLGGLPASVSGTVVGADVAGAVLTVQVPVEFLPAAGRRRRGGRRPGAADDDAANATGPPAGAVLNTVPIGSDGKFEITDVPSPRVYDLVVTKTGFATEIAAGRPVRRVNRGPVCSSGCAPVTG